jgi:pSer/pThr/pTyr-binding forkhead associated (FHA) protein
VTLRLPFERAVFQRLSYVPEVFDRSFELIEKKGTPTEGYFTLEDSDRTYYLFFLGGKPYYAGTLVEGGHFEPMKLKEFFRTFNQKGNWRISLYAGSSVLVKSLLVFFQNRPSIQASGELLDVESLLENIGSSGKNLIMVIQDHGDVNLVLFKKGQPLKAYFARSQRLPQESTLKDQLLVYLYENLRAGRLVIEVFEQIKVRPDIDSELLPASFEQGVVRHFSQTDFELEVWFDDQMLKSVLLDRETFAIGRHNSNDLVIDNLGVSRKHAVIHRRAGKFILEDQSSVNGTFVNSQRVQEKELELGDEIVIGKHALRFRRCEFVPGAALAGGQTMLIDAAEIQLGPENDGEMELEEPPLEVPPLLADLNPPGAAGRAGGLGSGAAQTDGFDPAAAPISAGSTPSRNLIPVLQTNSGHKIVIEKDTFILGKGRGVDLLVDDFLVSDHHAWIRRRDSKTFILEHIGGLRPLKVNGQKIKRQVLTDGDQITLGRMQLQFTLAPSPSTLAT